MLLEIARLSHTAMILDSGIAFLSYQILYVTYSYDSGSGATAVLLQRNL